MCLDAGVGMTVRPLRTMEAGLLATSEHQALVVTQQSTAQAMVVTQHSTGHSGHTAEHRPHVSNSLGSLDPQQDSNSAYKTFYMPTKGFCNVMELYKVLTKANALLKPLLF